MAAYCFPDEAFEEAFYVLKKALKILTSMKIRKSLLRLSAMGRISILALQRDMENLQFSNQYLGCTIL